jgi:hypothetical protein
MNRYAVDEGAEALHQRPTVVLASACSATLAGRASTVST